MRPYKSSRPSDNEDGWEDPSSRSDPGSPKHSSTLDLRAGLAGHCEKMEPHVFTSSVSRHKSNEPECENRSLDSLRPPRRQPGFDLDPGWLPFERCGGGPDARNASMQTQSNSSSVLCTTQETSLRSGDPSTITELDHLSVRLARSLATPAQRSSDMSSTATFSSRRSTVSRPSNVCQHDVIRGVPPISDNGPEEVGEQVENRTCEVSCTEEAFGVVCREEEDPEEEEEEGDFSTDEEGEEREEDLEATEIAVPPRSSNFPTPVSRLLEPSFSSFFPRLSGWPNRQRHLCSTVPVLCYRNVKILKGGVGS